jgi:hypothetical protein
MDVSQVVFEVEGATLVLGREGESLRLQGPGVELVLGREGWAGVRATLDLVLGSAPARPTGNRGKPWSDEEDAQLLARFDEGEAPAALATAMGRSRGAILARLARHGRVPPDRTRFVVSPA